MPFRATGDGQRPARSGALPAMGLVYLGILALVLLLVLGQAATTAATAKQHRKH